MENASKVSKNINSISLVSIILNETNAQIITNFKSIKKLVQLELVDLVGKYNLSDLKKACMADKFL